MTDFQYQSAAHINRLETRIKELEKENNELKQLNFNRIDEGRLQQLQEDYQISQSQIIAYKKQMDIGKKELEDEKRKSDELNSQLYHLRVEVSMIMWVQARHIIFLQLAKRDSQQQLNSAMDSFPDSEDSFEIPLDPNLICPKCGKQFRRGEIQYLRRHHDSDCISIGNSLEENPLMKGLTADMKSAEQEIKRMCSFDNSCSVERRASHQSSGEELKLNLTRALSSISSEMTKRTGDPALVVCDHRNLMITI